MIGQKKDKDSEFIDGDESATIGTAGRTLVATDSALVFMYFERPVYCT
jgi:hypothetical protein